MLTRPDPRQDQVRWRHRIVRMTIALAWSFGDGGPLAEVEDAGWHVPLRRAS